MHTESPYLGPIETVITGRKQHTAAVAAGERVTLEREPQNGHDRNAIAVWTTREEKAGYLPRRVADWLAPLLDGGVVAAEAEVSSREPPRHDLTPLRLGLTLQEQGAMVLAPHLNPKSAPEVLHNLVLAAYCDAAAWEVDGLAEQVSERLQVLSEHGLSPETRLLLAVLPQRGRDAVMRALRAEQAVIEGLLEQVRVGEAQQYRNVTLFPLYLPNGRASRYLLLQDAIEQELAEVREVSEGGSVSTLLVDNQSIQPVFIPEGEVLSGAKQNRVVNVSVLVPARCAFQLPVSCVEQGRWHYRTRGFRSSHYAPPRLRARKNASVMRSQTEGRGFASDQRGVWEDVAEFLREGQVNSDTDSLTDGFERARRTAEDYRAHLELPKDCAGAAIGIDGVVVGLDLFDAPETLQRLWPRLSEGYLLEAIREAKDSAATEALDVAGLLASVARDAVPRKTTLGLGKGFDAHTPEITAAGLHDDGRIVHVAVFRSR